MKSWHKQTNVDIISHCYYMNNIDSFVYYRVNCFIDETTGDPQGSTEDSPLPKRTIQYNLRGRRHVGRAESDRTNSETRSRLYWPPFILPVFHVLARSQPSDSN
jgi:hypothetical protein